MRVVVAINDTPYSEHVIDACMHRHWPHDSEFKVLTVLERMPLENLPRSPYAHLLKNIEHERTERAEKLLASARKRLEQNIPGARVHFEVRSGNPSREIVDAAASWSADRIMIGAHGRDVCPRNISGSVSRTVASHGTCSVEIIRPRSKSDKQHEPKHEFTAPKTKKLKVGTP